MNIKVSLAALAFVGTFAAIGNAQDSSWDPLAGFRQPKKPARVTEEYATAVRRVADMVSDSHASSLVRAEGLNVLNLTWEDTGRYKNSSVGPNISDMTIQVALEQPGQRGMEVRSMPVMRYDNFTDKTADLDPEGFTLLVGNEKGRPLRRVSLAEFLDDPTTYLTKPHSWKGRQRTLSAARDTKVLVSAQAAFLPVPKQGKATFNPVIFNYQSVSGDPAVLTILATREGTSTTVIDNKRDAFREGSAWGQRLFFNQNGQRASLTGERLSSFGRPGMGAGGKSDSGLNMVLLIQVPLKQRTAARKFDEMAPMNGAFGGAGGASFKKSREGSDVEAAVIGHGDLEGPFTEIDNLSIERDDRFPVRVTVQFYKATSNGIVSQADVEQVKKEIDRVYSYGSSVGSLVVGGETGRVTEYEGSKVQPAGWWEDFWRRHEQNTGNNRWEAIRKLRRLLGQDYMTRPVCRLYLNDVLRMK
ncbi:MAG: hypothetical protein ACAH95_02350 [Fimbriimonas sp.]